MKKALISLFAFLIFACPTATPEAAPFDLFRALSAAAKGVQAYSLTNEDVVTYVSAAVKQMDASNKVAPATSPYTKRLKRLTSNITKLGSTPLTFKVYITKDVNAFACADGNVRVYSGLMDIMSDDELMGIIGHEIGHVAKKHTLESMKHELKSSALIDALGSVSSTVAVLSDSGLQALGEVMETARYSRKQETEADNYAYDFMKKLKRNPYYLATAFEKLLEIEKSSGSNSRVAKYVNKMFSDHPETQKRITNIKTRCANDGYSKPSTTTSTSKASTSKAKSTTKTSKTTTKRNK